EHRRVDRDLREEERAVEVPDRVTRLRLAERTARDDTDQRADGARIHGAVRDPADRRDHPAEGARRRPGVGRGGAEDGGREGRGERQGGPPHQKRCLRRNESVMLPFSSRRSWMRTVFVACHSMRSVGWRLESSAIDDVTERSWVICLPIVVRNVERLLPSNTGSIWNRSSRKSCCVRRVSPPVTAPEITPPAAETSWPWVSTDARVSGGIPERIR